MRKNSELPCRIVSVRSNGSCEKTDIVLAGSGAVEGAVLLMLIVCDSSQGQDVNSSREELEEYCRRSDGILLTHNAKYTL